MNEKLADAVVALLKKQGQMTAEAVRGKLANEAGGEVDAALTSLVARGSVQVSPRGNYYVRGFIKESAPVGPVRSSDRAVSVEFGVRGAGGTGFSSDGRTFMPGDVFTNQGLMDVFKVGNTRGIRISKATGAILVISSVDNRLYKDRWSEGVFNYVGEGRHGDQAMAGGNLAIADAPSSAAPLLLFFKRRTNAYEFQGEVRLLSAPTSDRQLDDDGQMRRVWVYPLAPV